MPAPIIAPYDHHAARSHREMCTLGLKVKVFNGEQAETDLGCMNDGPHVGSQQKQVTVKSKQTQRHLLLRTLSNMTPGI